MENTLVLAQFLGLTYTVVSLAALFNRQKVHAWLQRLVKTEGVFFMLGTVVFAFGLVLTMLHNDWRSFGGILVGIIAWGAILESLLYLFLPHRSLAKILGEVDNNDVITASSIIGLGIGITLSLLAGGVI